MNCQNCNMPLNGSTICPNCHYDNSELFKNVNQEVNVVNANEVNNPPVLNVEDNLNNNNVPVQDITVNSEEVPTYEEIPTNENINQEVQNISDVTLNIPDTSIETDANNNETNDLNGDSSLEINTELNVNETIEDTENNNALLVEPKKKKFKLRISTPKLFNIILVVVSLSLGIFIGKTFFSTTIYAGNRTNNTTNNSASFVTDGKNNQTNISNYTFKIPKDYIYDRVNNGVEIYDQSDSWRIYIRVDKAIYEDIATAKTSIRQTLVENSLNINNIKEIKINDYNYFCIEAGVNIVNHLISYTKAGDETVFYIDIVSSDNTFDYDVLKIADDIISNALYEAKSTNMEKVQIYDNSALIIAASNAYKNSVK